MDDYHLVDAKQEYTSYLISVLGPSMYNGFRDMYEQAKKLMNGNSVYKNFQILLSNVPNWNSYLLEKEVGDIEKETGVDWLDNLITAVFVSHSKILTSVKVGNYRPRTKKIDLKIPDTTNFVHQCYLEASRNFYKNPFLFLDDTKQIKPEDYLKNSETCKHIIKESIVSTIRKMLPFKNILNEYLSLENNVLAIGAPTTVVSEIPPTIVSNNIPIPQIPMIAPTLPSNPMKTIMNQVEKFELSQPQDSSSPREDNNENNNNQQEESDESSSESEKEILVKGKQLNLDDMSIGGSLDLGDIELEKPKPIQKRTPKKQNNKKQNIIEKNEEESINSKTVEKLVNDIKKEFKEKEIKEQFNEEKSINLDNLSFDYDIKNELKDEPSINLDNLNNFFDNDNNSNNNINNDNDDDIKSNDSETTVDRLNNILGTNKKNPQAVKVNKEEPITKFNKEEFNDNRLVLFNQQKPIPTENKESIDIEKIQQILKEEGTIISNSKIPVTITPIINENKKIVNQLEKKPDNDKDKNSDIKKISIKYSNAVPITKKKNTTKKKKTTLIDEADDDDSSEMVF